MKATALDNLNQLKNLLQNISTEVYTAQPEILSGASIGQHMRHIVEFYALLLQHPEAKQISYDERQRDESIENSSQRALSIIEQLITEVERVKMDQPLTLVGEYSPDEQAPAQIKSSMGRELAYCIEHSIHHQALIKAGLIALGSADLCHEEFGVAYSTLKYREELCAQ